MIEKPITQSLSPSAIATSSQPVPSDAPWRAKPSLFVGLFAASLEAGVSRPCKFRLEFFDSALRIDKFLLARIEGVAGAADIDLQFLPCTSGLKRIATTAFHVGLEIFWVDVFFHWILQGYFSCRGLRARDKPHDPVTHFNLTRLAVSDKAAAGTFTGVRS